MQTASDEDYRILELGRGASLKEVKDSYRDLVQVWHPDNYSHQPKLLPRAHRKMVEINLAYPRRTVGMATVENRSRIPINLSHANPGAEKERSYV